MRDHDGLTIAPPSHGLEAVYCFSYAEGARHLVSSSLACIIGAEPRARVCVEDFPAAMARARSIKRGTMLYERIVYRTAAGTMHRIAFAPFRIHRAHRAPVEVPATLDRPGFADFDGYIARLVSIARSLADNAGSPDRAHGFPRIVASVSSGYDSAAAAVIARTLGPGEAVTLATGRGGRDDSGRPIAEILGMQCHEYPRFATGVEQQVGGDFWLRAEDIDRPSIDDIEPFLASIVTAEDAVFAPFAPHLEAALYFTGFHGDKVWSRGARPEPVIERGDNSGSGLDEFRRRLGFVHVPLAFIDARHSRLIGAISRSAAMAPYRVGGAYDRPIPRRIVESAGVPRATFGIRKAAGSVRLQCPPELRYRALLSVAERYAEALREAGAGV